MKFGTVISATLTLAAFGCATPSQMSADAEVNRLCAIDGGVKVYETVKLPAERFDQYGNINLRNYKYAKSTDEYYFKSEDTYLNKNEPYILRAVTQIIRRNDGKILGESVRYGRGGGDIPGPWHPSTFDCPAIKDAEGKLESSIFVKGGGK